MAAKQVASRVKVELLFDVFSPYAYIQLEMLHRNRSNWPRMDLELKPVLLGGIIRDSGNVPPFHCANKGLWVIEDLKQLSKFHKIPLTMPGDFLERAIRLTSMNAQRFLTALQSQISSEQFTAIVRRLFAQVFIPESRNIAEHEVILAIALEAGLDENVVRKALDSMGGDAGKGALKLATEQAIERGVFGLPSTFVHTDDGPRLVWGSDRLHVIGQLLGESNPPIMSL